MTEGVRGFYSGLVPSLFGVAHGAVQFMVYEELKRWRQQRKASGGGESLSSIDYIVLGSLGKIVAGVATFPYQVLRTKLQNYDARRRYRGLRDAIVDVWTTDGPRGFYRGMGPNLIRVLPSSAVMFLVYENIKQVMTLART